MILKLAITCIFLYISAFSSSLFAGKVVTIASGEWAPYSSRELKGFGLVARLVTESFSLSDIDVEFHFMSWPRAMLKLESGLIEASMPWFVTPERKKVAYISAPLLVHQQLFFYEKNRHFDWKTIGDLKSYSIGTNVGYSYGYEFDQAVKEKRINIQYAYNAEINIKKLLRQRIDVMPMEKAVGYRLLHASLKVADLKRITHHPKPVVETSSYLLVSKKLAPKCARSLINSFNKGLKKLKQSGRYQQLLAEYHINELN